MLTRKFLEFSIENVKKSDTVLYGKKDKSSLCQVDG